MSPVTPTRSEPEDDGHSVSPTARSSESAATTRPVQRPRLSPAVYWLTSLLTLAALVASVVGVFFPGVFRDPPMTTGLAHQA